MYKSGLKVGDKVRLKCRSLGWFPVGAELTFDGEYMPATDNDKFNTGRFTGPAAEAGVGGLRCEAGDIISGYAYFEDVELAPASVRFEEITITVVAETMIRIPRKLTSKEAEAIRAIVGV